MVNRRPLVAGNWKLNGSRSANRSLVSAILDGLPAESDVDMVLCPPFVYLPEVSAAAAGRAKVGAQDVAAQESGAFTGEVSATMLRDVGCDFVIIGHSERRALFGDTDEIVSLKVLAALAAGLRPILCVGETLEERESGQTLAVVNRPLGAVLAAVDPGPFREALIAYEPVWAIGTGRTATPAQAQDVHREIRATLARRDATMAGEIRLLYGGSVKASNAKDLFAMQDIDGGLIGGASLLAAEFLSICRAAAGQ